MKLEFEFQSLTGFRIPWTQFQTPRPKTPDPTRKFFPFCGFHHPPRPRGSQSRGRKGATKVFKHGRNTLCTDVPPPSGKIGRGDVVSSTDFSRGMGDVCTQARAQEPLGTDSHQASGQEHCVTILKTAVYGCVPDYSHPA